MALLDIEREAFSTFGHIPGVGKSISVDLWDLGLRSVQDLEGRDPEDMFEETRRLAGGGNGSVHLVRVSLCSCVCTRSRSRT